MRNFRLFLVTLFLITTAATAQAQATRTWVSGVGDDVNPCSRTAPCKTWAGAISKTAAGGEIDALDPGGFGALTIVKSITIDGAGTHASILAAGFNGIVISAAATDHVYIRNISINGGGSGFTGIRILQAGSVTIENVTIFNFNASTSSRAISILNSSNNVKVNVLNSTIRHIAGMGIESIPSGTGSVTLSLDGVRISQVAQSAVDFDNNTKANISRSTIVQNVIAGLFVERATCIVNVYDSVISQNAEGINIGVAGGGLVRLYGTQITGNTVVGIQIIAGTVESYQNNALLGNTGAQSPNLNISPQ
jgi:hypothetical protein